MTVVQYRQALLNDGLTILVDTCKTFPAYIGGAYTELAKRTAASILPLHAAGT